MKTKTYLAIALASLLAAPGHAVAGPEVNTTTGAVIVAGKPAPGLAVHGFDVVAYFAKGEPIQGDAQFAVIHNEATYRFASQESLDAFKANPTKYEPAYGGYCAYGVSVGAKFDGDPRYWKNLDAGIQKAWFKDVPGAIRKADANWPKLAGKFPAEIK